MKKEFTKSEKFMNKQIDSVAGLDDLSSLVKRNSRTMLPVINAALELITEELAMRSCFIARYEKEIQEMKIVAAHNVAGGYDIKVGTLAPFSQSLLSTTSRSGESISLLSMDIQNGQAFFSPSLSLSSEHDGHPGNHRGRDKLIPSVSVEGQVHPSTVSRYIAVPIVLADGTFFGALCAIDLKPLELHPLQSKLMIILARFLAIHIERDKMLPLLQKTKEEGEKASNIRRNFFSVVNHEFRTKLTSIQGFSELIRDQDFSNAEIKEYVTDIHTDAQHLSKMISELLDLERMESGEGKLNPRELDLNVIIMNVVDHIRPTTPLHTIHLELDANLPLFLGDHDKLTQVVSNLLSNAIKYAPDGGLIRLHTQVQGNMVHVFVQDEGVGIPSNCLAQIFEHYYSRAEGSALRYIKGSGVGLSIVRQIVQLHGGKVWAESTVGLGSTFHFVLPLISTSMN